jgi:hypothetical protein
MGGNANEIILPHRRSIARAAAKQLPPQVLRLLKLRNIFALQPLEKPRRMKIPAFAAIQATFARRFSIVSLAHDLQIGRRAGTKAGGTLLVVPQKRHETVTMLSTSSPLNVSFC